MRLTRPAIYLLAAIALGIAVLLIENPDKPRVDDSVSAYLIPNFASSEVHRMEISQLISGAQLERTEDGWRVAQMPPAIKEELYEKEGRDLPQADWQPADRSRVETALGSFGGLEAGVVVSRNPENRRHYQLGPAGLKLRLLGEDGEVIADLIIGKSGQDFGSTYVMKRGTEAVLLVRRPLVGAFSPDASDWLARGTKKDPAGTAPPRDPSS